MTDQSASLADLRRQIDDIDTRLHDLLMRRGELVQRIAAAKGGTLAIRPDREAQIARRLASRHSGPLPFAAVLRIWREIIATMTVLQGKFSVAVWQPAGQTRYWDLARDHFGSVVPATAFDSKHGVLRALTEDASVVGVLPWPEEGEADPWWRWLAVEGAPRVIAYLPQAARGAGPEALLIARSELAASGDDHTWLAIETAGETSRARLIAWLNAAGLEPGFFASHGEPDGRRWHLVDVADFLDPRDARLAALTESAPQEFERLQIIGAYATPLTEESLS